MIPSTHVAEHCATPKITRRWRKLGQGAVWRCTCGKLFATEKSLEYDYPPEWRWKELSS
jgi:hypothetical protein